MQIAFWSPNHGQTATTTSTIALASTIAIQNTMKILVGHSHFCRSTLERCLVKSNSHSVFQPEFVDKGMDALKRLAKNGRLYPEMVSNYTTSLLSDARLDMLEGIDQREGISEDELDVLSHIFKCSSEVYDLVFIDVHSGMNHRLTRRILDHVDLIVVCLNQNVWLIEDYLADAFLRQTLASKNIVYHIGLYDSMSKYTLRNLEKIYDLSPIIGTPYNIEFGDACNSGNALDFILRHSQLSKKDRFYGFEDQLKLSAKCLMEQVQALKQEEYV